MNRFRFSLGSFLVVVTLLALGLAALVSQSRLAASAALTAYLVMLCVALAGAMMPHAANRAFWIGLAVFGWTYWFFEFDADVSDSSQPAVATIAFTPRNLGTSPVTPSTQRVGLLTENIIYFLESQIAPGREIGSKVMAQWRGGMYYSGTIIEAGDGQYLIKWDDNSPQQWTPSSQILPHAPSVRVAAHAMLGTVFALLGGVVVAVLFGARPKEGSPPKSPLAEARPAPPSGTSD